MLAADLNATPDNLEFRRLLHNGYRDAAEQAGAGLTRTHPSDVRLLPPVFAVDHILTRSCAAISVCTLNIPGSDHRALASVITVPTWCLRCDSAVRRWQFRRRTHETRVLEHVADEDRALSEIRRVLKSGGCVVVINPNRWFRSRERV